MPEMVLSGSQLSYANVDGVANSFIMRNPALESILFNRNVVGLPFAQACEDATTSFLLHLQPELSALVDQVAEMVILTKGTYYWMHHAYARAFGSNLQANYVDTNRVEASESGVRVAIRHSNLDAPAASLIIGDTIASGATICAALAHYLERHRLERVFLFSVAGSKTGGQAVADFCRANAIDLYLVYGLAAFGLAANGFDLSFLDPETITTADYIERARSVFHGKPVSSVGWDFGSQVQAIRKYRMLCWIEARYWGLEDTDVFQLTEPPVDPALVQKERGAFSNRFPDLSALLPDSPFE